MLNRIIASTIIAILAYGFWISPDFKQISAGVAIFMFGMLSLEEGFKAFTGGLLENLLRKTTNNIFKSILFGTVSTTVMQSSSLVSVITISFLSAGLISLTAGIGIIFGANLGTTTGAWLIAGFGMKVDIAAYAMPMLVFGVIGIFQNSRNLKGLGYILTGVGFLFLGIQYMKEGFDAFRDTIDLAAYSVSGYPGVLLFALIGIVATVIMQSSHATLVIIITALATQQITYENALALAIGANIGTTVTAIIGSLSANIDGKRLAAAHLVFNLATALIAIVFIRQFGQGVDWISTNIGISTDDYTLKLAVFHSVFNTIGIIVMLPHINRLAEKLTKFMPGKIPEKEKPIYLTKSAEGLADTAIEAVRKETLHLYDNAFTILAHGLNLHRHDILSSKKLSEIVLHDSKLIHINFDQEYDKSIKSLYSDIIQFISRVQTIMTTEQTNELFHLRSAGRDIVESIKDTKHMHKNLSQYIFSSNRFIRAEYNNIRVQLGSLMRELETIRTQEDDPAAILSLDTLKLYMKEHDTTVNGQMESLIRENKITAQMATSLMNDATYAYGIAKNLISMGEILFASGDLKMKEAQRSIALTDEEVARVLAETKHPDKGG